VGTFARHQAEAVRPAPATYVLRSCDWASSYEDRPLVDMKIGLRMLSDEELDSCRDAADKAAEAKLGAGGDAFLKAHKKSLISTAVARALCMPEDSAKFHEAFPCPDDQLPFALREETIVSLFDIVERTQLENSPVYVPATDDEIADLMAMLGEGELETLDVTDELKATRIRRLLAFCLAELTGAS
jgi:hypothetical protein